MSESPAASTSPRTSAATTMAPATGFPRSADLTVLTRPLVPESRMSYETGSPPTTTVDACGR